MEKDSKLQVYQGIIRYIIESTNYSLSSIADLADCSIEDVCSIYNHDLIPPNFLSDNQLIKLFQLVLALHPKKTLKTKYFVEINEIPM